jgi:dolichyl-phosphate-mannose-protein mannosyltransferase
MILALRLVNGGIDLLDIFSWHGKDHHHSFFTLRLMHWVPFFLMGRMLFLHHYMPAFIFSVCLTITLFDFVFRDFHRQLAAIPNG